MKRTLPVLTGFLLGVVTLGLQLSLSLAEPHASARENVRPAPLHAVTSSSNAVQVIVHVLPTAASSSVSSVHPLPVASLLPVLPSATSSVTTSTLLSIVDQPGVLPHHKIIADHILRMLPESCLSKLDTFVIRYDHPTRRGLAGKGTIIVSGNVDSDTEFEGLLLHEGIGHFYFLTCLDGNPQNGVSAFQDDGRPIPLDRPDSSFYSISWTDNHTLRMNASDEDFASTYGKTDPFEDLAEFTEQFYTARAKLAARAKTNPAIAAKLAWMEKYAPSQEQVGITPHPWPSTVGWDATRMAFQPVGEFVVASGR